MNTLENMLDKETADNLKLKGITFDIEYKINNYTLQIDQSTRKLKLLNEKFSRLNNDLQ